MGVWREEDEMSDAPVDMSPHVTLVSETPAVTGGDNVTVITDSNNRKENSGSTEDEGEDSSLAGGAIGDNDNDVTAEVRTKNPSVFTDGEAESDYEEGSDDV